MSDLVQISVVAFKRVPGKSKSDGWEQGIAFVRGGDVDFIIDRRGAKLRKPPLDRVVSANNGSFRTDLDPE